MRLDNATVGSSMAITKHLEGRVVLKTTKNFRGHFTIWASKTYNKFRMPPNSVPPRYFVPFLSIKLINNKHGGGKIRYNANVIVFLRSGGDRVR